MKKVLLTMVVASFCTGTAVAEVDLANETDKLSYSLGLMIGDRVTKRYGDLNYDALLEGIQQQHEGAETEMTLQDAQTILQEYEQKAAAEGSMKAKAEGDAYLAENKAREGVMVTDSGLQYEVLVEGDGPKPAVTDKVSVHYVGTLIDGKEFDSSIARGAPAEFGLQGVIPGWTEGLQLMNTGSKYRFVIPSDLGYGDRGAGADIGPGSTLIFEVELLEIK